MKSGSTPPTMSDKTEHLTLTTPCQYFRKGEVKCQKPPLLILTCEGKAVRKNSITLCILKALTPNMKKILLDIGEKPDPLHWVHSKEPNCSFTAKSPNFQEKRPYQHLKFTVLQQPLEQC